MGTGVKNNMLKIKMTKRHFLKKNDLMDSYIFIGQYHKYNAELRGVIIQTLFDKYNLIYNKQELETEVKLKILSEIELEIMCKVMELTESLASVCFALTEDELKIKLNFVDFEVGKSDNFYKNIRRNNQFFYKMLTYSDITNLPITLQEKRLLKRME